MATSVSPLNIASLRRAIRNRTAYRLEARSRASVVLILHPGAADVELLLIRRAKREGDPWSGHMALPGGHQEADDADDLRTALRETREEIGLELERAGELVGRLDDIRASARGRALDLVITPFVYQVGASPRLTPSDEVAAISWVSLSSLADGRQFSCHAVEFDGRVSLFPAWAIADQVVWGLTYRIITGLLRRVLNELEPPPRCARASDC